MLANAFVDKPKPPTDSEVAAALGPAKMAWDRLLDGLAEEYGVTNRVWKCYSAKWGWSLHAKRKDRTIVWLSPHAGSFGALIILGPRAIEAAGRSRLPARLVHAIAEAPKYPEGTGVRLELKAPGNLGAVKQLAAIKLAN
jgi:hypothetical protein